jgi:predicted nucleic acid-binding protein
MLVLDASAAVDLVLELPVGVPVAHRLRGERSELHAPSHIDVEVLSAIRRAVLRGLIPMRDGQVAVDDFKQLPIRRWLAAPFLDRALGLSATVAPADALYVALAESLGATLITTDAALSRSHGHGAVIELIRA